MQTAVKSHSSGTWTSPASTAMFWAAMEEHAQALAQRIRHFRKAKGWSKERLALEAGLSSKTIKRLEKAEIKTPQSATYDKLADALGIEVRQLDAGRPTLDELEDQGGPLERLEDLLKANQRMLKTLVAFATERATGEVPPPDEKQDDEDEQDADESGP
jgi:transcriptional regulator with XRE-family HTH domain